MSNKRPQRRSVRFELSPENPQHELLRIFLLSKAKHEEASEWIRSTLIAAIPGKPLPAPASTLNREPRYEPVEE